MSAHQDTRSQQEHIQALKDFVRRVARISNYEVPRIVKAGRLASTVEVALGGQPTVNSVHPTDEQIDAFVLNLRLFIQSGKRAGENISFPRMAVSFEALPISAEIKASFARLCAEWDGWLNSKSPLGFNGEVLTNLQIRDSFVYGNLAHINNGETRATHDTWASAPVFYPLLKTQFVFVIGMSMEFLLTGSGLCERALAELGAETHAS